MGLLEVLDRDDATAAAEAERLIHDLGPSATADPDLAQILGHTHHLRATALARTIEFRLADEELAEAARIYRMIDDQDGLSSCEELRSSIAQARAFQGRLLVRTAELNSTNEHMDTAAEQLAEASQLFLDAGDRSAYLAALGFRVPVLLAIEDSPGAIAIMSELLEGFASTPLPDYRPILAAAVDEIEEFARRLRAASHAPAMASTAFSRAAEGHRLLGEAARELSCRLAAEALDVSLGRSRG